MKKKTHQETYEDKIRALLQNKGVAPKPKEVPIKQGEAK